MKCDEWGEGRVRGEKSSVSEWGRMWSGTCGGGDLAR